MSRIAFIAVILLAALLVFGVWYEVTYSMDEAAGFEIGMSDAETQILIAYQGSKYKNRVVEIISEHYFTADVYLKGVDIADLPYVNPNHWDALLLIHTWEIWQPPVEIEEFVESKFDESKMVVLTTSGDGNNHMEQVDAITSASIIDSVSIDTKKVLRRLDSILHRTY